MTNENLNVAEEVVTDAPVEGVQAEEVKPKRVRRQLPKNQATVGEIIASLEGLKTAVSDLEEVIGQVPEGSTVHGLVIKELMSKRKELEDALNTIYYF